VVALGAVPVFCDGCEMVSAGVTCTGGDIGAGGGVSNRVTSDLSIAERDSPLAFAQPSSRVICDSESEKEYVLSRSSVFKGRPDLRGSGLSCWFIYRVYLFTWTLFVNSGGELANVANDVAI